MHIYITIARIIHISGDNIKKEEPEYLTQCSDHATVWTIGVGFIAEVRDLSRLHNDHTGYEAQPVSYLRSNGSSFPEAKAAEA
jgi:hypothetical protein